MLRCVPGVQVLKKEDEAANAATYACELEKVHARVYHVPVTWPILLSLKRYSHVAR